MELGPGLLGLTDQLDHPPSPGSRGHTAGHLAYPTGHDQQVPRGVRRVLQRTKDSEEWCLPSGSALQWLRWLSLL